MTGWYKSLRRWFQRECGCPCVVEGQDVRKRCFQVTQFDLAHKVKTQGPLRNPKCLRYRAGRLANAQVICRSPLPISSALLSLTQHEKRNLKSIHEKLPHNLTTHPTDSRTALQCLIPRWKHGKQTEDPPTLPCRSTSEGASARNRT
eukprot:3936195-Rhodomonas_salina.1